MKECCETCKELRKLRKEIGSFSPGPWEAGYMGLANGKPIEVKTKWQFLRHMAKTWRGKHDPKRGAHSWHVCAKNPDGEIVTVAVVGNGSHGEANSYAIEVLPKLIALIDRCGEYEPKEASDGD